MGTHVYNSLTIHRIKFGNQTLIRWEPIELSVTKSECGNYVSVEADDLWVFHYQRYLLMN